MTYAIIGSRDFTDYELVKEVCSFIDRSDCIVSGGARGADSLGKRLSGDLGCTYREFPALWDKAGYMRNVDIIDAADVVIAFWDGESKGTAHSINLSNKKQC